MSEDNREKRIDSILYSYNILSYILSLSPDFRIIRSAVVVVVVSSFFESRQNKTVK